MIRTKTIRDGHVPQKTGFQPSSSIKINLPVQVRKGVDIDEFIRNMNLEIYAELDEEEQEEYLAKLDAIELFEKIKALDEELAHVKLDMHCFTVYLQQNNPKLLIGLKQRQATAAHKTAASRTSMSGGNSRRLMTGTDTMSTSTTAAMRTYREYHVNFGTKADMAERAAVETEKRIKQIQKKGRLEIKEMKAEILELHCRVQETDLTCKNFVLNFMADEGDIVFLETANEAKIIDKLKQFTNNWFKRARGLMATMRLRMSNLNAKCRQIRTDIIVKADLSKVLSAVDFDQLIIRRNQLLSDVDEVYKNMYGVRDKTGKALMLMGEEKASMVMMEQKHKQMLSKMNVIVKHIVKLETECQIVELSNIRDTKVLEALENKIKHHQAPSVSTYVERKQELLALEKEEKILLRKIRIMNMTLSNLNKHY